MALFNMFGSQKTPSNYVAPTRTKVANIRSGVDCYGYRGTVEDYFFEVLQRNFPIYEVSRNVSLEAINAPQTPVVSNRWTCACGAQCTGAFCANCGSKKPEQKPVPAGGPWKCSCGSLNQGNFCSMCGSKRPVSNDWICSGCGSKNKNNFCPVCGMRKPAAPAYAAPIQQTYAASVSSKYPPLSFVLYQGGRPKMAIYVCSKRDWDKTDAYSKMDRMEKSCKKEGIAFQRYFREFRNDEAYIRHRIMLALR